MYRLEGKSNEIVDRTEPTDQICDPPPPPQSHPPRGVRMSNVTAALALPATHNVHLGRWVRIKANRESHTESKLYELYEHTESSPTHVSRDTSRTHTGRIASSKGKHAYLRTRPQTLPRGSATQYTCRKSGGQKGRQHEHVLDRGSERCRGRPFRPRDTPMWSPKASHNPQEIGGKAH